MPRTQKQDGLQMCNLSLLLDKTGMSVEEAAVAIGDSPLRLYRVLEGDEPFGRTATLAALALKNDLPIIKKGD